MLLSCRIYAFDRIVNYLEGIALELADSSP
ncbi:hypothetical protein ABID16_004601 [Rhizobium aquaticum]|uniref:Uncharacterized protein n=1 Tax=Rhizobium aquaticum TaxID=1549636 RepID=A0ABV2J662_9HYPH